MYKNPHKYTTCMSTYYVESFNNAVLVYIDKRIHFRNLMYLIRMGLTILDWNEHVDRPATSVQYYVQPGNVNPQGTRILSSKTNNFVHDVWTEFLEVLLGDEPADNVGDEDMELEEVDSDNDENEENDASFNNEGPADV